METLTEKEVKEVLGCLRAIMDLCDSRQLVYINYANFSREDLETIIKKLTGETIK